MEIKVRYISPKLAEVEVKKKLEEKGSHKIYEILVELKPETID